MRLLLSVLSVLVLESTIPASARGQSNDGYIGVYADSAGTQPCTTVQQFTWLYVIAKVQGTSAGGITSTEFRIEVENSTGWQFQYSAPMEATVSMGNPMDLYPQNPSDGSGLRLAFDPCLPAVNGMIPLGMISVRRFSGASPTRLLVKRHSSPSNPDYQCPLFVLCDQPTFSKSCMTPSTEPPCSLSVAKASQRVSAGDPVVFAAALNVEAAGGSSTAAATFQLSATLQGSLPVQNSWSPTGQRLAFVGMDGGLYTFDGDTPGTPPVLVLPPSAEYTLEGYIIWSPDAKWIACRAHGPNDVRAGLASILARNAAGSGPIRTMVRGEVAHFTWATNGNIYFWDSLHRRSVLSPPTEWQPVTLPLPDRPFLLPTRPGTRVVFDFRCQPQENERQVSLQAADVYAAFPIGTFPDMQRYLFTIQDNVRGFYTAVVDFNGTILVDLGDQVGPNGFISTSLSPDGQYVLGVHEVHQNETIVSERLNVVAADGSWRVPVEPPTDAFGAHFARSGDLIAYRELATGAIRVGHLHVSQ